MCISADILLIVTIRPENVEAVVSFQHCMAALKELKVRGMEQLCIVVDNHIRLFGLVRRVPSTY